MTYDHEVALIAENWVKNGAGDWVPNETRTTVLCAEKSVTRGEFYQAAMAGLKPEVVLVLHRYEYNGERKVEYEGAVYSVVRTYAVNTEEIELMCERVLPDQQSAEEA